MKIPVSPTTYCGGLNAPIRTPSGNLTVNCSITTKARYSAQRLQYSLGDASPNTSAPGAWHYVSRLGKTASRRKPVRMTGYTRDRNGKIACHRPTRFIVLPVAHDPPFSLLSQLLRLESCIGQEDTHGMTQKPRRWVFRVPLWQRHTSYCR